MLKRRNPLRYSKAVTIGLSLTLGIVLFTSVAWAIGVNPIIVLETIATSFIFPGVVKEFLVLTLLGYALLLAFKASLWNIGAEGQFHFALLFSVYITLILFYTTSVVSPLYSIAVILLSIVAAIIAGALWGFLAGFIKAYLGVDEVPLTLILNYIVYYVGNILVLGPFQGKSVYGYKRTDVLPNAYRVNVIIWFQNTGNPVLDVAIGYLRELITYCVWVFATIIVALIIRWLLNSTIIGLGIRVLGSNPDYLLSLGYNVKKLIILTFTLSGALVGFTASLYFHGYLYRLEYPLEVNTGLYGYLAILVAWLSLLDLTLIPVSAYIVASLMAGSQRLVTIPEVKLALEAAGFQGAELSFRLLMFGSILLMFGITRFIQDYEIRVIRR